MLVRTETVFSPSEKPATLPVKKKRDQRRPNEPKFSVNGRPGKRTPQLEKDLLAAIETGAPYRIACMACGISDDAFANWRRKDPSFADRVNKAAGQTALRLLKKIEKNADENFSAAAWLLERRFPESFSRPEIQLGLTVNQTMNNNVLVISVEQAESLSRRNKLLDKQLDEVAREYESRRGSAGNSTEMLREVEVESSSSLVATGPIALPPVARRTASWWRQLVTGDAGAQITPEAAQYVIKAVATDALGAQRAESVKIDLDDGTLCLRDVWAAVQGFGGWEALVARGTPQDGPGGSAGRGQSRKGHPAA
jgi:hypothetical protein